MKNFMKKNIKLFLLLCVLLHACNSQSAQSEDYQLPTILIFDRAPSQAVFQLGTRRSYDPTMAADIAFMGINGLPKYFSPSRTTYDTLMIPIDTGYIEIAHRYKGFDILYFYIKTGDTVLFTYDEDLYPFAKSYTSDELTRQYNFFKDIPSRQSYYNMEPFSWLFDVPSWFIYERKNNNEELPESTLRLYIPMDTVELQAINYLQEYDQLLKKRHDEKIWTNDVCCYYAYQLKNKRINYNYSKLLFPLNNFRNSSVKLNQVYKGYFQDEHYKYVSYLYMVDQYLRAYAIGFPKIIKNSGSSGSFYNDYRIVFDSLCIREDIPLITKSIMLYNLMDKIIAYFPVKDAEHYKELYVQYTGDSLRAKNKLLERGITATKNEDIVLRDANGKEVNYETIRQQYKGKVLYVDFWASWCAPCRAAMPEALKLRKEYAGKEVVFLYLALNDREDMWKAAATKEQLDVNGSSYFIVNSKSSEAIKELKVESIPRYILYDKTGKLVYFRAPGPHGNEIREQLNQLLKE